MSAQLKIPDEFELTVRPSSHQGNKERQRRVRRDRNVGGVTHRVKIGDMVLSSEPMVMPSSSDVTELASHVSSPPNALGEQEERMTASKNGETRLVRELVVRTWPFALFLVLALWAVGSDALQTTGRVIVVLAGVALVIITFYFWFPRNGHRQNKTGVSSREKLL